MKRTQKNILALGAAALFSSAPARALDQIVHPFQTTRQMSMGGTKILTGIYDENFWGNPARAAANPKWKLQLFDLYGEANANTFSTLNSVLSGSGTQLLSGLASSAGKVNHVRAGLTLLGIHVPGENWSFSFGIQESVQADVDIRKSYQVDPQSVLDLGVSATLARKLLEDKSLVVGVTAHGAYRVSSQEGFSFTDLIRGDSLSPLNTGSDGGMIDFDLGATYKLPWKPLDWDLEAGATLSHILGGTYRAFDLNIITNATAPLAANRQLGLGVSARAAELWKFTDFVLAFEASDIGNNGSGSFWRWFHLGSEAKYGLIALRAGINQGYFGAGVGFDLKVLQLELGTWGEEYSLNPGGLENRIYGLRFGFNI